MNTQGIHEAVALFRVSTRLQERKGESLPNQERAVRAWAAAHGITIVREIRVAESGKSALRLVGDGFRFSRRAKYSELLTWLQRSHPDERPQAVLIDWIDRWSRNTLEYVAVVTAFRELGIKMFAVSEGRELTDPANALELKLRAAFAEEQLATTSGRVKQSRRARREKALWQGGSAPDGYRTHSPECAGGEIVERDDDDGSKRMFKARVCSCKPTILQRDPNRSAVIEFIWQLLATSPKSWAGMAEEVNKRGFRRPDGNEWRDGDLYRIGENPHYAGILVTDRSIRDPIDSRIRSRKPLKEQGLTYAPDAILNPYISQEQFWEIYERRFNKKTRYLPRAKGGSSCELTGLVHCPQCGDLMSSFYLLSPNKTGHGNPRRSPRRKYVYLYCPNATKSSGRKITCKNSQKIRSEPMAQALIEKLAKLVKMSDEAISRALEIKRRSKSEITALQDERRRLQATISITDDARHTAIRARTANMITQKEFEEELFRFRKDKHEAETRLHEIDRILGVKQPRPNFEMARNTLHWLASKWPELTVAERAEALRLLVDEVTYTPTGSVHVHDVRVNRYGPALLEPPPAREVKNRRIN